MTKFINIYILKKSSKKISKKKQIETIEYKNKTYILEDNQAYKINENNKKGKLYGTFIDGKIKKTINIIVK